MSIELVIFDYDGVLVDSFPALHEIYLTIGERFQVSVPSDIEAFRSFYGYNYMECLDKLGIPRDKLVDVQSLFKQEVVKKNPELFPEMKTVLEEMSEEYELVIVSANRIEEIKQKLERFDIEDHFSDIIADSRAQSDEPFGKVTAISEYIAEHGYEFSSVVSIGDRDIDFDVAEEIGIPWMILTNYGWGHSHTDHQWLVNTPRELPGVIEQINAHL